MGGRLRVGVLTAVTSIGLVGPAVAGAYSQPSGLTTPDVSAVCPPRPADSTSADAQVVELVTLEQAAADGCARSEQLAATSTGWSQFGSVVALTVGLVLIVVVVAGVVVVLWR
jgi:hypothetical protein